MDVFANPEALWLLLLVPVYLFWYFRYYRKQRLVIRLSYDPTKLQKPRFSLVSLRMMPRVFQVLSLVLLILAIARPQRMQDIEEKQTQGVDIILALDISASMETEDFNPNRLKVAKTMAAEFIQERQTDRIGVVLFAAYALSYTPLTLDYDWLVTEVDDIQFDLLPRQGTAIGSAVALAINRLREGENPSRVIVLLTDGANNRGEIDPITAAKLAASYGIRIYCIGIGKKTYIRPGSQQRLDSELDEVTLNRVAQQTGGTFFRVDDAAQLQLAFRDISRMEKGDIRTLSFREVEDLYPLLVKIAIFLLGLSFILMLSFMYNPLEH